MIGNDIIDIEKASKESNWLRKGYLQKVYTSTEQIEILSHANPDFMIWLFWSMKEATYKAHHRMTSLVEYAPSKISCHLHRDEGNLDYYFGSVSYHHQDYYTQTQIFGDYIHTIALYSSTDFANIRKIYVGKYQRKNYMKFLEDSGCFVKAEKIVKNKFGLPELYDGEQVRLASISHHGNYLGIIATH